MGMSDKESEDERVIDNFKASDIDDNGFWILPNDHKVDLRNVQLHLPNGRGHEWVIGVVLSPKGYYDECPLCHKQLTEGLLILLENHHYLIVRCCDKLFLYENQKLEVNEWI
tara:strand:+ start:2148 stop:2483 length:336 start_codon:yes stop_codon:yes gene_type:complete